MWQSNWCHLVAMGWNFHSTEWTELLKLLGSNDLHIYLEIEWQYYLNIVCLCISGSQIYTLNLRQYLWVVLHKCKTSFSVLGLSPWKKELLDKLFLIWCRTVRNLDTAFASPNTSLGPTTKTPSTHIPPGNIRVTWNNKTN